MNNIDGDGKVYLENFLMDFLNISNESLKKNLILKMNQIKVLQDRKVLM